MHRLKPTPDTGNLLKQVRFARIKQVFSLFPVAAWGFNLSCGLIQNKSIILDF